MTVPSVKAYTQYTGTGARTFFEYGFEVFPPTDVVVTVDGKYVSFTKQETGVVITPAPALDSQVIIYRVTDIDQLLDFQAFESFDGQKTEWALDKLIYLKQEALVYRAFCNLYGVPYLDHYDIQNDKGEDAHILLWNETNEFIPINEMGVFAGEVTDSMPNAGQVVLKPDHFAYFQYGGEDEGLEFYTTTPYPIEIIEGSEFGVSLGYGFMRPVPEESTDTTMTPIGGAIATILYTRSVGPEDTDTTMTPIGGAIVTILNDRSVGPENTDTTMSPISGAVVSKLVTALTPNEGAEFGCTLGTCSMDAV